MDIVVCIKLVPENNEMGIDRENYLVNRNEADLIINPLDMFAIEEALKIKDDLGGKVIVISMGNSLAEKRLKEVIAYGVDEVILLSDKIFAGSDTLATSYILSRGIKKLKNFDLIICGKNSTDGDTGQVGPSLAEKLKIPHTIYVKKINKINKEFIICQRITDSGYDLLKMPIPSLITVVKEINNPRFPTLKGFKKAKDYKMNVFNAKDILAEEDLCGLKGSPTKVIKVCRLEKERDCKMIENDLDDQIEILKNKINSILTR